MKKSLGLIAFVLGLAVLAGSLIARGAANAGNSARSPLTYQQGRADVFTCPSPAPGAGSSGKIVTVPGTTQFYGTVNCPQLTAYLYHGRPPEKPVVTRLRLVKGASGLRTLGVSQTGEAVGYMLFGSRPQPYRWTVGGEPIELRAPSDSYATAVGRNGLPIVGESLDSKKAFQAAWFAPTPGFFIPPAGPSFVYAVNDVPSATAPRSVYAGQLGGVAAAAYAPGALRELPIGRPSSALAINPNGFIVGRLTLPGACGPGPKISGFGFPFPEGRASLVPPLSGDCASSAEDVNASRAVVGFSYNAKIQRRAEGLNLTNYPPGLVDLNATRRYGVPPWARLGRRLIYASGTDDRGDIAATDSAGSVWFLHIP
jgi:hypothetical protein